MTAKHGTGPHPAARLNVVICWHMHQPEYRDPVSGEFLLPWTYLHGIKDYTDMAAHLESVAGARAVVNFAPVLLEQLAAYSNAIAAHLATGSGLPDSLLATLTPAGLALPTDDQLPLIKACLRAHRENLINRFPRFQALAERAEQVLAGAALPPGLLGEISVWYHLAWMGESVRRSDPRVRALAEKAQDFDAADRRSLLSLIGELIAGIVPRYRALAEDGRVELSVTPWGHPIMPLLLDVDSAREQQPDAVLPRLHYPGGAERVRWHLKRAIEVFTAAFGRRPLGCWPSEGALSDAALGLIAEEGFTWTATGESVLRASLAQADLEPGRRELGHRPWQVRGNGPSCFFRDDDLSDRIGFTYSRWHGDDAAANFVHYLDDLARRYAHSPGHTVAVILDGENAWEHYPFNGYYFLHAIYDQLAEHPNLRLATFRDVLAQDDGANGANGADLPHLVTGSWVHGTLSTWIGSPAKNRAFELLCEAKQAFDEVASEGALTSAEFLAAQRQLGVCEGSDWAWWFADFNAAEVVADFDGLYRRHLTNLYRLLKRMPPSHLSTPFAFGGGGTPEQGGTMRRAQDAGVDV